MTAEVFKELVEKEIKKEFTASREMQPFYALKSSRGLSIHKIPFEFFASENTKDLLILFLRRMAYALKAEMVAFCTEAWVVTKRVDKNKDLKAEKQRILQDSEYLPPSEDPERREVVMVHIEIRAESKIERSVYNYAIERDEVETNNRNLGEKIGGESRGGRFSGILN